MSGDYETHNDRQPKITYTPREMTTYHNNLNDKCLFKNLNQEEFDVVWSKIYYSYWKEDLTYSVVEDTSVPTMEEASF